MCPKKCIIILLPKKCIIALCPKKSIIACARYCMCPKKCIIACAQRNASLHCVRDCIAPEICISPSLHCARNLLVPESNQVTRVSTDAKNRYTLFTHNLYLKGVILQRHHLSWPADFMSWPEDLFYAYHVPKAS